MTDTPGSAPGQPASTATAPAPSKANAHHSAQASPESLDQVIETTKTRGWWAVGAIAVAIVIAFVWACVAEIPQQNSAVGVVSSLRYAQDVSAPVSGIASFNDVITHNMKAGDKLGEIIPFNGGTPVLVSAPTDGAVSSVYVTNGEGVEAGQVLAKFTTPPDLAEGITVATYVPAQTAITFYIGETADVSVTNLATSQTVVVEGVVTDVADSPSSIASMTNMSGSESLSEQWSQKADGTPFRIMLNLKGWPSGDSQQLPAAGQVVSITHTYGSVHPIQLLFGGS